MALEFENEHVPHGVPVLGCAGVLLVAADVPDIPFARECKCLSLRQRLSLAPLRGADCRDPCLHLGKEFADEDLRLVRGRPRGDRNLCFRRHAVESARTSFGMTLRAVIEPDLERRGVTMRNDICTALLYFGLSRCPCVAATS